MALSISGLGTGLDTAGIVAQLMQAERVPQAKIQAAGATAQREVGAWNELRTKVQSLLTAAEALRTPARAVAPTATSSSPAVRVTAGESATAGSTSFVVRQLATAEQRSWSAVGPAGMVVGAGRTTLAGGTLGTVAAKDALDLRYAEPGVHTVSVTRDSAAAAAYGTPSWATASGDLTVKLGDGTERTITLAGGYADQTALLTDLNEQFGDLVKADVVGGRLRLSTYDEGGAQALTFSGTAADALGLPDEQVRGQDAVVVVNGQRMEVTPAQAGTGTEGVELGDTGIVLQAGERLRTGTIKVNVVETSATDTLTDLAAKMSATGSPLSATLVQDPATGLSSLRTTATGTGAAGSVEIVSGHPLLDAASTRTAGKEAELVLGTDPLGTDVVTRSSNTITDLVPGLTVELLYKPQPTAGAAQPDPVTVTAGRDSGGTKDRVKALVDAMNGLLADVKAKTRYDVAAGSGAPLAGSSVARGLASSVFSRAAAYEPSGEVRTLSQIGISTTRDGTFAFSAEELTKALEKSPDDVAKVLASVADGLAVWAKETSQTGGVLTTQRDGADAEVVERRKQSESMEVRLARTEERYRKQFSALEAAMAALTSQRNAMSAALGSLPTL